ncbi:MAG: hypothetical protein JXQ90_22885 [Cyclobacteriaceae bacterium]
MTKFFASLLVIINYKTIVITVLSVSATYLCIRMKVMADMQLSMVSIAIVFPIVFAINTAYQRREEALQSLAGIKGHLVALFLAVKHWGENGPAEHDLLVDVGQKVNNVWVSVENYLVRSDYENTEFGVYNSFSFLSETLQNMRGVVISSEISRINEYVSMMLVDFENLKIIREYRTPITLRTYSKAFIYTFPILFSPFFASTIEVFTFPAMTYMIPAVYTFILISLTNIQEHMEDPFDGIGEDDIKMETERFDNLLFELDANHLVSHGQDKELQA